MRPPLLVRVRALLGNSAVYLVGDALGRAVLVLLIPVFTRVLSPDDFGVYAIVATVTALLTLVFGLALSGAVSRLYFEAGSEDERRSLYGTLLAFLIVCPLAAVALIEVLGQAGALDIFENVPYDPYMRYAVFTAYAMMFLPLPVAVYASSQQPRKAVALTLLNVIGLAAFTVLFVVVLDQGVIGMLRGALSAAALSAVVAIAVTVRMASLHLSRRWLALALAFSLPLVPHLLAQWILNLSDRLVLERYVSETQVGLYALGYSIGLLGLLLTEAVHRAATPIFTEELKAHGDSDHVRHIGTYSFGFVAFGCLLLAAFGGDVLELVTPASYDDARIVVPWVALGVAWVGLYNVISQGTWYSMRTRWIPVITLAAGAVNIALNFLLVPKWGISGSAVATAISYAVLALLHGLLANQLFPIRWEWLRFAKIGLAAGAVFAACVLLFEGLGALTLAGKLAFACLAFPLALTALRFWSPKERLFLRGISPLRSRS